MKEFVAPGNLKPTPYPVKSWKSQAENCTTQDPKLRKLWSQPDWMQFKLRSKTYLQNKIKEIGAPPLFELVWFESFKGTHDELMHVCSSKKSFASKAIAKFGNDVPQLFVVTLIIPGSPLVATVQYFARTKSSGSEDPTEAEKLWERFLNSDDAFRSSRFKLIPTIVDGPWVIRKSVGTTPCIIGKAIKTTYYKSPNYLEVHVDISSDTIAKHITSLCRSQSTNFTVDMGFVIEGQTEEELPEALLGCVQSARQAKRLAKEREAEAHANGDEDAESEEEELEEKRPANVGFAFLADSDDSESDGDESEEEQEDEEQVEEPVVAPEPLKSKKKNKNKKKGAGNDDEGETQSVDDILDALAAESGNLSVDEATSIRNEQEQSLFGVQLKFANADKEMKRIFGVKEGGPSTSRKRGDPRSAARVSTKKVMMVSPMDEWPRPPTFVGGGIRWTRSNKPKGTGWNSLCNYYEITWSIAYKKLQEEFELLQWTHDPNLIAHFLQRNPYHIDALLTMSEVFQHHGQMDHATDCIKRCMYVLELAWADQFDVSKGNCRMDIKTEHNAGFFRALFLLMKQVGRRGCMRSAFETAKLLLSLDPQGDPMNVLLAVDYYALTSRQCQFLIDLFDSKTPAVDRFASDEAESKQKSNWKNSMGSADSIVALPNLQFSLALAYFFIGNETEAKENLAIALLKFPTILKPLLEKIAANPSSSSWQPILSSRVFANARSVDGVLQHLLDIYVTRNHSVWKVNDAQSFLLRSAQHALASPALVSANAQVLELPTCLHKYIRAVTADYSDEITTLPADHPMLQPPQLQNGQPLDAEALAALARAQEEFEAGNLPADANPLLLFLQTLLPWNHVQGAGQQPPQPPQ
ncbi:Transcriptional repressor TCF25 [Phytophthora infestans]|uniref:Transcriptional repressor TCF25 n=1 Tax=Phytophthora infestans TaxID=4787 RepID=A0A833TCY4_PHYIN|nr:Transcriptional repressor TCF25 [Phytophthora infestans]